MKLTKKRLNEVLYYNSNIPEWVWCQNIGSVKAGDVAGNYRGFIQIDNRDYTSSELLKILNEDDIPTMENILMKKQKNKFDLVDYLLITIGVASMAVVITMLTFTFGTLIKDEPTVKEVVVDMSEMQGLLEQLDDKLIAIEYVLERQTIVNNLINARLKTGGMLLTEEEYLFITGDGND